MPVDLFLPKQSMKDRVRDYCAKKIFVSSIDLETFKDRLVRAEGHIPGYLRVHREARQLAQEGVLKRLTNQEKLFRGFPDTKIAVYEYKGDNGKPTT